MFSFIRTHCKLCALIFTIVNWFVWVGFYPSLQNDDFQIYSMLCGYGENPGPYGIYTNIVLGYIIYLLQHISTNINWYLAILFSIAFTCTTCFNFLLLEQLQKSSSKNPFAKLRFFATFLLLLYVNRLVLSNLQYTHVGTIACCTSALLVYRILTRGARFISVTVCLLLTIAGFSLRNQTLVPFSFACIGMITAGILSFPTTQSHKKSIALVLVVLATLLATLSFTHRYLYENSPEWQTASDFLEARVSIQDYPDNSGLDKTALIEKKGLSVKETQIFRSFIYVPGMDHLSKVRDLADIHRQGRKGLMGSSFAAEHNILTPTAKQFKEPFSSLMTITPWGTLGVAFFLFVISINRQSIRCNGPVLLAFGAYMACLLILGRSPGRVVHPMVITTAFWVLIHLPNEAPLLRKRWMAWGSWGVCALGVAFCFRHSFHWRPSSPRAEAHEYCAARPENLYITTNQQGCGLFPVGFTGYSMDYLHKTNVLPVGDGWMFYTPAYRAALAARKIENPYRELLKDNVYVITFRQEDKWVLKQLSALHELYTGQGVEFSKVHAIGEHSFWKAHQLPNAAK